jgi:hypothetical protein
VDGKVNKGVFYNVKIDDFNEYELIGSVLRAREERKIISLT